MIRTEIVEERLSNIGGKKKKNLLFNAKTVKTKFVRTAVKTKKNIFNTCLTMGILVLRLKSFYESLKKGCTSQEKLGKGHS